LQTTGFAFGATSTKSKSFSSASSNALLIGNTPTLVPVSSMT